MASSIRPACAPTAAVAANANAIIGYPLQPILGDRRGDAVVELLGEAQSSSSIAIIACWARHMAVDRGALRTGEVARRVRSPTAPLRSPAQVGADTLEGKSHTGRHCRSAGATSRELRAPRASRLHPPGRRSRRARRDPLRRRLGVVGPTAAVGLAEDAGLAGAPVSHAPATASQ